MTVADPAAAAKAAPLATKKPKREVNPVWLREMRQAARLGRTPLILATLTAVTGLLVCSIGGVASTSTPPAEVGVVIFQTFFSLAFAVVCWIGPGVAASTIASERAGHTYESLILTGLSPRSIARGKFLAALTYIGMYLVALAPVGAVPFLFGGVTPTEVLSAFVILGVFAVLAVGFGLAVSSATASPAVALLITLPVSVAASLFAYFLLGVGLSVVAHDEWSGIAEGLPVWLPTAYVRAEFGFKYLLFFFVLPLAAAAVVATFFYEVTVANLSDPSDDRSTGIKGWFLFATLTLLVVTLFGLVLVPSAYWTVAVFGMGQCLQLSLFALFVLATDPPGPSRRIRAKWTREGTSLLRRFMGPGIAKTALLLVAVFAASEAMLLGAGIFAERMKPSPSVLMTHVAPFAGATHTREMAYFAAYALAFFGFLSGLSVFLRSRPRRRFSARALLTLVTFCAFTLPLFVVGILSVAGSAKAAYPLAAPSPVYVFAMMAQASGSSAKLGDFDSLPAGFIAIAGWAVLGLGLGVSGAARARREARDQELAWKALDEQLAAEDGAAPSAPASLPAEAAS